MYSEIVKRFKKDQEKVEAPANLLEMQCHAQQDINFLIWFTYVQIRERARNRKEKIEKIKGKQLRRRLGAGEDALLGEVFSSCRVFSPVHVENFKLFHSVTLLEL